MYDSDTDSMYGSDMERGMYDSDIEEDEDMQVSPYVENKASIKKDIISLNMKNTIVDTLQIYDPNIRIKLKASTFMLYKTNSANKFYKWQVEDNICTFLFNSSLSSSKESARLGLTL